jgi:hypothetical protein
MFSILTATRSIKFKVDRSPLAETFALVARKQLRPQNANVATLHSGASGGWNISGFVA